MKWSYAKNDRWKRAKSSPELDISTKWWNDLELLRESWRSWNKQSLMEDRRRTKKVKKIMYC
jgi:hypothetical protein